MDELRARFESLELVTAPDVWDEVQRRVGLLEATAGERVVSTGVETRRETARPRPQRRSLDRAVIWWLLAATLLAVALLAGALVAGGGRRLWQAQPSPTERSSPSHDWAAANGLLAYSTNGQLFLAEPDGTNRRLLASGGQNAFLPRWSPDGQRIAFLELSCSAGQPCDRKASPTSVVVMNADGSGRRAIEQDLLEVQTLEWSPDGTRLAFDADRPEGVHVVAADGSQRETIGNGQYPMWSPDSTTIAYYGDRGTHLVAADGTGDRRLLEPTPAGEASAERWSPDGSQLAFVWHRACCPPANRNSDTWIVDRSGSLPHRMTEVPDGSLFEGWSPDGQAIAYLDPSNTTEAGRLVLAHRDGANPRSIALVHSGRVNWSPDGTRLFLIEPQPDSLTRLVFIDPTGVVSEIDVPTADGAIGAVGRSPNTMATRAAPAQARHCRPTRPCATSSSPSR